MLSRNCKHIVNQLTLLTFWMKFIPKQFKIIDFVDFFNEKLTKTIQNNLVYLLFMILVTMGPGIRLLQWQPPAVVQVRFGQWGLREQPPENPNWAEFCTEHCFIPQREFRQTEVVGIQVMLKISHTLVCIVALPGHHVFMEDQLKSEVYRCFGVLLGLPRVDLGLQIWTLWSWRPGPVVFKIMKMSKSNCFTRF